MARRRTSRTQQKAETRQRLLDSARRVFLTSGFHAATLEAIALEAGVTKGAVYSNFDSKARLFLAVNGARMDERQHSYKQVRASTDRLEPLVREYARIMIRHDPDGRWASVVAEAWAVAASDQVFRTALIDQSAQANAFITDSIRDLGQRANVGFPLPMETMGKLGSALMRGLLLQRLL